MQQDQMGQNIGIEMEWKGLEYLGGAGCLIAPTFGLNQCGKFGWSWNWLEYLDGDCVKWAGIFIELVWNIWLELESNGLEYLDGGGVK